ncbi:MAG TPA: hypothetical protein VKS21_05560 [Spirochaetota bacterium]|nr:hypothetical protein [Spirochaetota bacterium]
MKKDIVSAKEKVNFQRWTNKAINAKKDIARAFFNFALILREIKEQGYYDVKYKNFKNYCENEIDIKWQTAYDYVKIANFVVENKDCINQKKALVLGHKKLKLLSQKLSKIEAKFRKAILKKISEDDSFTSLKNKVEKTLKKIK